VRQAADGLPDGGHAGVLEALGVEVRVLQRQGRLHRHHLRQTLIMRGKPAAAALVDQLQHAPKALGATDRHGQQVPRGQRRFFVDAAVETVVMLGVVDNKGLAGAHDLAADAGPGRQRNALQRVGGLARGGVETHPAAFRVDDQHAAAFRAHYLGRQLEGNGQDVTDFQASGEGPADGDEGVDVIAPRRNVRHVAAVLVRSLRNDGRPR